MNSAEVLSLYNRIAEHQISIWIDGGWCVDALLGRQTREHSDVDVAVHRRDNVKLRILLESRGYQRSGMSPSSLYTGAKCEK